MRNAGFAVIRFLECGPSWCFNLSNAGLDLKRGIQDMNHRKEMHELNPLRKDISAFLLGFLTLSFQIFLMREFCAHFYGNEISLGLLLGSWLLWGGLGSMAASCFKYHIKRLFRLGFLVIALLPLLLIGLRFSRFTLNIMPGEISGMIPILLIALFFGFILSTPFGILFVFNVKFQEGNLSRVYLLESLGAAFGGLVVQFLLIPYVSNWQGVSITGVSAAILIYVIAKNKKLAPILVMLLVFISAFMWFDGLSQEIYWKPFQLLESRDSPYGKLHVIKTEEQVSLYNNNLLVYSHPDRASAEESVHFALLQYPDAEQVLLVGGATGGELEEVLKYPRTKIDYVEIDPEIVNLSLLYLPDQEKKSIRDNRVQIHHEDGRVFLFETPKKYDVIILNVPEPSTAQLNRYYTKDFYLLCKKRLSTSGVLAFKIPSAENYISPQLQTFLTSLYYSLKDVFAYIAVVPGSNNVYLSSQRPLSLDYGYLTANIHRLALETRYVNSSQLAFRLDPIRIKELEETILAGEIRQNSDLSPISYFLNSILWGIQFNRFESRLFLFLAQLDRFWLLDLPLILFILLLTALILSKKRSSFSLVPLAVMGFTSIVTEFILILVFQISFGSVYGDLALLFSCFMFGLFLGSLASSRRKSASYLHLCMIQPGFVILLSAVTLLLGHTIPSIFLYSLLIILGFLGGELFVVSNRLYLNIKKNFGLGYGLDLLGSSLGALTVSSILIPLVGLVMVMKYAVLLNSACLLFLVWGHKQLSK